MEATSLPNLNRESTSYHNFFTFFQDPNHHDDTTLHKRPKIDHSQVSEPSETSPFKDILSPFVSFNESDKNHYPVGEFFCERNQKDQTPPRRPPSPARSSETTVSVGSNPFSGSVGARSEGPNVTQLRGDQTLPSMSSVGTYQSSGNVGARSAELILSQLELPGEKTRVTTQTWTTTDSDVDVGFPWPWRLDGWKDILNAKHPRFNFFTDRSSTQGLISSDQALGGHMRRHRAPPVATETTARISTGDDDEGINTTEPCEADNKPRKILHQDLNLAPFEDDFEFIVASKRRFVLSAPALVDCYY